MNDGKLITPDLILMDCHMPVLDGFAATTEIRHQERSNERPLVPVIAVTANVIKGFREQCLVAGMNDYLSKPFDQRQLVLMLRRWLPEVQDSDVEIGSQPPVTPAVVEGILDSWPLAEIRALQRPGQPNVLAKVIGMYQSHSPTLLQGLRVAAQQGDAGALMAAAHSLKSSSANLGAARLANLCKTLELQARGGCLEGTADLIDEIESCHTSVLDALQLELIRES